MRFSLFYVLDAPPNGDVGLLYRNVEEQAIEADRLGFDAVWVAEHHFKVYGRLASPFVYLARLSVLAPRIDLGIACVQAPHHNPIRLAEDAATLDLLTGGRHRLGVGSGTPATSDEFVQFGHAFEEKTERTLEILEILRRAYRDPRLQYEGQHYRYERAEIVPRPTRPVEELIWVAASREMPELAGRHGYGLLLPRVGPAGTHNEMIQRYRAALQGRPGKVSMLRFVYAAETERAAREETRVAIVSFAKYALGIDWDGDTASAEYAAISRRLHLCIGTPEQVTEQISAWEQEFGVEELMCQLYAAGIRHEDALRSLRLLGAEVLPAFPAERHTPASVLA